MFGMTENVQRRALATVLQMGSGLAKGSIAMLEANNWYAAVALSRQLVEVEYLVWLFGIEPNEPEAWLAATQKDLTAICSAVEPQYIDMLAISQKVFSVRVMH